MMMQMKPTAPSSPQLITCLFCQAGVRVVKFQSHITDGHQVFFDHSLIFKLNELGKDTLEKMVAKELIEKDDQESKSENSVSAKNILLEKYPDVLIRKVTEDSNTIKKVDRELSPQVEIKKVKMEKGVADQITNGAKKVKVEKGFDEWKPMIHVSKVKEESGTDKLCNERNKVITLNENDLFDSGFGESCNLTISVTECNKLFSTRLHLLRHKKIHTGEKDFECQECPKKFSRKDKLVNHKRTHTGEKFTCDHCENSYSKKDSLKKHMKNHTGDVPQHNSEIDLNDIGNIQDENINVEAATTFNSMDEDFASNQIIDNTSKDNISNPMKLKDNLEEEYDSIDNLIHLINDNADENDTAMEDQDISSLEEN